MASRRRSKNIKSISNTTVDALRCPPDSDRVFLWDADLSGFGVVAMPSGSKMYVAQFRQHGRQRRMKLGQHGRITPHEARSMAKKVLGAVEDGKDPIQERQASRSARTFKEVASDYLRLHVAPKRKERTHEEYERLLNLHIFPAIGSYTLASITKPDIARLHASLADRPSAANRCLALIDSVWNWAIRKGELAAIPSPTKGLDRNPEASRERYLTPPELQRLGKALREAETIGLPWVVDEKGPKAKHLPKEANRRQIVDEYAVAAIRLLMLTGARLREILQARWDYVDEQRGLMFLPDSKTGRKTLYLSDAALDLLASIPKLDKNPHIIPGTKKGSYRADLKRPWAAIARAAALEKVRLHDLRHTFASVGVGSSLGLPVVGKLLGHSQPRTTQRYAHLDADPARRAANLIGGQIAAALAAPQIIEAQISGSQKHKPKRR